MLYFSFIGGLMLNATVISVIPATELLYLNNTYQFEGAGKLLRMASDQRGIYLVFDQTIFYPQGGGQPG